MTATDSQLPWHHWRDQAQIELGTVGWDDEDKYYEISDGSDDGHTLVRVQLYRGRMPRSQIKPGVAQGYHILCMVSSGIWRVPPKGTRVLVAIPFGMEQSPVGGVIIATIEKNPPIQFNDDRVQIGFGDSTHVVIRGKSVTIADPGNRFVMVGTSRAGGAPGILLQDETGSGGTIQSGTVAWFSTDGASPPNIKTIVQLKPTELDLMTMGSHPVITKLSSDGKWVTLATGAYLQGGGVYLGAAPTAVTTAVYGPTGVGAIASTSVFISP